MFDYAVLQIKFKTNIQKIQPQTKDEQCFNQIIQQTAGICWLVSCDCPLLEFQRSVTGLSQLLQL